jgi:hypothetical protein
MATGAPENPLSSPALDCADMSVQIPGNVPPGMEPFVLVIDMGPPENALICSRHCKNFVRPSSRDSTFGAQTFEAQSGSRTAIAPQSVKTRKAWQTGRRAGRPALDYTVIFVPSNFVKVKPKNFSL